jgi:Co/Zn/Cd efflux system component
MADCCDDKVCAIDQLQERQSGTLKVVLGINSLMFIIVLAASIYAASTSLLADSLDNLGDALTYAVSIYAVGRSVQTKGRVAFLKGTLILGASLFVIGQVIFKLLHPSIPVFETMGLIGVLALAANATSLALLWKHRNDDVNMSSVWECSRNDIAANIAVLVAATLVWFSGSGLPDIVIGGLLALLFLRSAVRVLRSAGTAIKSGKQTERSPQISIQILKRPR